MNQLKKIFLGLAVTVALGLIGANNASAQNGTCTAGSVPTLVRSQGIAELTGAITLTSCTTGLNATSTTVAPNALAFSLTDTIQPSAAVITNSPSVGTPAADFIPTSSITVNCTNTGTGTASVTSGLAGAVAQPITCSATPGTNNIVVLVGAVSGNTITYGYTITALGGAAGTSVATMTALSIGPVPGTLCSNANTFCDTVGATGTITVGAFNATVGIRANVFASGITFPAEIAGLLTSSPPGLLSITNNFLNVAIPQNGLTASFGTAPVVTNCATRALAGSPTTVQYVGIGAAAPTIAQTVPATPAGSFLAVDPVSGSSKGASGVQLVTITEGFASAFLIGGGVGANAEGTDSSQGTRVVITVGTLPSNTLLVAANDIKAASNSIAGTGPLELVLVPGADSNGAGAGPANPIVGAGATTNGATVLTGNTVTYEVAASSNAVVESIVIPIAVYTTGTPTPFGTSTISAQLGPVSTIGTAIVTPIPRFGAVPTAGNFLIIAPCLSNIFVPWAANTAGYDTGFAIANTTTDIFGTASQSGTCVYNFFGTNSPSGGTFTTAAFGGGTVDTRLLSNIAPGFFGYIIIQCNFQLGHGFEFIVNGFGGGTPTVGQGGEALIIIQPTTIGVAGGSRKAAAGLGEVLGH